MNQKPCRCHCDRESRVGRQLHINCEAFARELAGRGYAVTTIGLYRRALEHFGQWLRECQVAPWQIRLTTGREFLEHLRHCRCRRPVVRNFRKCRAALRLFLDFLGRSGLVLAPPKRVPVLRAADRLLLEFDQHLDRVQGVSALTRRARKRYAAEFLEARFGRQRLELRALKAGDLLGFVNARALTLKRTSLYALVVGLRSFLRFLEFSGRIRPGLAGGIPSPACPPPQPPLKVVDQDARRRFLRSFDRTTRIGRRDYAMALCFTELALRANEVADLTLEDVDWRASTLRLRQTKQRRERLLPLPSQVARALVAYLQRGRLAVAHRALFVSLWTPSGRPLSTDAVRHAMGRAFARCGIEATGPHILRRSWATLAHRRGAGLKLIADVLGHRSLETTAPYAQVHLEELRQAALPWPRTKP
jgi:site-specific recombinase XerD